MKTHYIAGSIFEGCGHSHKTIKAATKCLNRIERRPRAKVDVYKMVYRRGKFVCGVPMLANLTKGVL
jgi:hypothetical protein